MYQTFSEGLQIVKCFKDIESRMFYDALFFSVVICFEIFRCLFHPWIENVYEKFEWKVHGVCNKT